MTDVALGSAVTDLADRFWQWFLVRAPMYATVLGDERYDDRLPDPTPEGRATEVSGLKGFLEDAQQIERSGLSQEDSITLDMLEVVARIWLRQHEHDVHHFDAMDQMGGPQNLPGDMSRFQRLDTPERLEKAIVRLEQFPALPRRSSSEPARRRRRRPYRGQACRGTRPGPGSSSREHPDRRKPTPHRASRAR